MTKTKTHKWVEEIMQLGFDVAMGGDVLKSEEFNRLQQEKNYDKVVKKYVKKINNLLTQTQQDTLRWCLDEVDGLKYEIPCVYKNCAGINLIELAKLEQTIKKRMGGEE